MAGNPIYSATEPAFAKLNFSLQVRHRRSDGYHELSGIMQSVSLADEVALTVHRESNVGHAHVVLESHNCSIRGDNNLIVQAAQCWLAAQDMPIALDITLSLDKQIPVAAGLAGGSTDAAATLRLLQNYAAKQGIYVRPLNDDTLLRLAADLGADIPFCLAGGTAFVRGIGEQIEPIELKRPLYFILVKPHKGISTEEAFRSLNRSGDPQTYPEQLDRKTAAKILNNYPTSAWHRFLSNDFYTVAQALCPELAELYTILTDLMPTAFISLSGSGPTLFAAFTDKKMRDTGFAALRISLDKLNRKDIVTLCCSALTD